MCIRDRSYALVTMDQLYLFVNSSVLEGKAYPYLEDAKGISVREYLERTGVTVMPYDGVYDMVAVSYTHLVVGFAKAILVILQGAMIIDTIVFYASQVLQGMPPIIAAQGMLILQTLINFFIPDVYKRQR